MTHSTARRNSAPRKHAEKRIRMNTINKVTCYIIEQCNRARLYGAAIALTKAYHVFNRAAQ
jgi:hypothetical protein